MIMACHLRVWLGKHVRSTVNRTEAGKGLLNDGIQLQHRGQHALMVTWEWNGFSRPVAAFGGS